MPLPIRVFFKTVGNHHNRGKPTTRRACCQEPPSPSKCQWALCHRLHPFAPDRSNSLATDYLSIRGARAICRWLIPKAKNLVIRSVLSIDSLLGIGDRLSRSGASAARASLASHKFPRGDAPGYGDYGRWPIGCLSSGIANINLGHW